MGSRWLRRRVLVLLVGTLFLSVRPTWASCSPPEVVADREVVSPGEPIRVSGTGWADNCGNPREGGCGRDERPDPPAVTAIEVALDPVGAGAPIPLGTADAVGGYEFELDALVPLRTRPGRYTLEARAGGHLAEPPVSIVVTRP